MERPQLKLDQEMREIPTDAGHLNRFIEYHRRRLYEVYDPVRFVRSVGKLGSYLRIANKLDDAEKVLQKAMDLIEDHDLGVTLQVRVKLQIARVLQWRRDFKGSSEALSELLKICERDPKARGYLDFVWHQAGKNFYEQERFVDALRAFETAMNLRRKRQASPRLLASSRFAIIRTKRRLLLGPATHS